jgi:uncharacterized membrane protein
MTRPASAEVTERLVDRPGPQTWPADEERLVASFENTVMIRRPIEDVFAFLSDFENIPKWNYAIVETRKVSEGP